MYDDRGELIPCRTFDRPRRPVIRARSLARRSVLTRAPVLDRARERVSVRPRGLDLARRPAPDFARRNERRSEARR